MGAMMGSLIGLGIGFVFGTMNVMRFGSGPRGFIPTMGKYMGTSAASFGFLMAVGSVVRSEAVDTTSYNLAHAKTKITIQSK